MGVQYIGSLAGTLPSVSNPFTEDSPHWEAALELYHLDRVKDAFEEIQAFGVGEAGSFMRWYRVIEAETLTRTRSHVVQVAPWLLMETVATEVAGLERALTRCTVEACDEVADRLGWSHGVQTCVSILTEEADAPWAANPYGYCVSKDPYEKICLPNYLVDDLEEFSQAVAHEYAHVISDNLSDGYAPRWLEETVSVLAERKFDDEARAGFCSGVHPWLTPGELELTIEGTSDDDGRNRVWLAYQQAGLIGRYLTSLHDERRLGDLLREHANESPLRNLRLAFTGRERVDGALRAVYGFGTKSLFEQSLQWLRADNGRD